MNIWTKYADKVIIVAPLKESEKTPIEINYQHSDIKFIEVKAFDLLSLKGIFSTVFKIPRISLNVFKAMYQADHIHLRCPGNIGLIGCIIQIFFPSKSKTAKYAGNWDPESKQPFTYRLQKSILNNTFLTKNMQVLIYGKWENTSKNIKPFFTATYSESDKIPLRDLDLSHKIKLVFAGTLVSGKNPSYAISLVEKLSKKGYDVSLKLYGEGNQREILESHISKNKLENIISLEGNQPKEILKKAYQDSHFVILPSESEGWPKVVAEGMFWGSIPIATSVSCVPFMLDYGNRGVLLKMNSDEDVLQIENILEKEDYFQSTRKNCADWSRNYTLDVFENEIKQLL